MDNSIQQARTFIGNGDASKAVELLLTATKNHPDFHTQILVQSSKLKTLARELRLGIISDQDAMLTRNQIAYALLEIINLIEPLIEAEEKKRVFISYNHADADVAHKIKSKLEAGGIDVTIDSEDMAAGQNIKEFIEESVRNTDITVSVVSRKSLLSAWVAMETIYTFNKGTENNEKVFIPCYTETDFFDQNFTEDAIPEIAKRLSVLNEIIKGRVDKNMGFDDLYDERGRLLDLKQNLDKIVGRLRNSLCIDIREENFEQGIFRVIQTINS